MLTQEAYLLHYYRPTLHINLTGTSTVVLRWFIHFHPAHHTPTPPPRLPLRLVYTQKYLNVFECTQPYFVLLQETLNCFSLLSRGGGARTPGPPLATPLIKMHQIRVKSEIPSQHVCIFESPYIVTCLSYVWIRRWILRWNASENDRIYL